MPGYRKAWALPAVLLVAGLLAGPVASRVSADEPVITLPDPDEIGPVPDYTSPPMQPQSVGDDRCSFEVAGWEMAEESDGEFGARRLEGEVVIGHTPHGDAVINHHTEDANFFVVPDNNNPLASYPNVDYRNLLGRGNYQTGEPKEHGRIEVENEYGALPWNDAADDGFFGFPPWAWPATGDRAIVEGYWVYDCGHGDPGYRTEIHPAWMVATIRNTMQSDIARGAARRGWVAPLGPDDASYSRVTKADIWISSFGGEAVEDSLDELGPDGEDWWQPVNSRNYDFDIPLPPDKPSPDAQPVIQILDPPGTYWKPPGAVSPSFGPANITPATREGFLHVHIPFASVPTSTYMLFGKTIIAGWNVPAPKSSTSGSRSIAGSCLRTWRIPTRPSTARGPSRVTRTSSCASLMVAKTTRPATSTATRIPTTCRIASQTTKRTVTSTTP